MMTPIYILLSSLPTMVCLFWTLFFLFHYRGARPDQKIMCGFMFTATVLYFGHYIFFTRNYALLPFTDTLYNFTTIAVYPIYFIYILSLTEGVTWKHALILTPAVLLAGLIGICYALMPADVLKSFLDSYEYGLGAVPADGLAQTSRWAHNLVKMIFAVQMIPILYYGLKKIKEFRQSVSEYFSGSENETLQAIRTLLIFFVITSICSITVNFIGRTFFTNTELLVAIPSLLFSALLFSVGYAGSVQTFTVRDLLEETRPDTPAPAEQAAPEEALPESDSSLLQLRSEIDQRMTEEKLYLNPQLKISDIANSLNTNRTYVYNALSCGKDGVKESFTEYVNGFRIRHAMKLLEEAKTPPCIEDVLYESGFQSKSTFYTHFKKITGMTPATWIRHRSQSGT